MSTQDTPTHSADKAIGFADLWLLLSERIGNARLAFNPNATALTDFLDKNHSHHPFITDMLNESFNRNRCKSLSSPIKIDVMLDVLGETAHALAHNQQDDLMNIELIEEIGWHIVQNYAAQLTVSRTEKGSLTAQLLDFPSSHKLTKQKRGQP